MRRAVVVNGGNPPHPAVRALVPRADLVVAVDSGLEHAQALGLPVDVVVGDFDSVSPAALARAEADGVLVERHPVEKDATDLELGVGAALERGATDVTLVSGDGGRLDHLLGGLAYLASDELDEVVVDGWVGPAYVMVLRDGDDREVQGRPGELISVLPMGGFVDGVTLEGFRYELHEAMLLAGTTLGISNEFVRPTARIRVTSGCVLVIQPERLSSVGGAR